APAPRGWRSCCSIRPTSTATSPSGGSAASEPSPPRLTLRKGRPIIRAHALRGGQGNGGRAEPAAHRAGGPDRTLPPEPHQAGDRAGVAAALPAAQERADLPADRRRVLERHVRERPAGGGE